MAITKDKLVTRRQGRDNLFIPVKEAAPASSP
jgi:hypothetical protein